jgi:hypothetical protein
MCLAAADITDAQGAGAQCRPLPPERGVRAVRPPDPGWSTLLSFSIMLAIPGYFFAFLKPLSLIF